MLIYRGTQQPELGGRLKGLSYTTSLPAAILWSSRPGDVFASDPARRKPTFLPGSTVHIARLVAPRGEILELAEGNYQDFDTLLGILGYEEPNGITHKEALKVLQYLHNRLIGKVEGGEFEYRIVDREGDPVGEVDLISTFLHGRSDISEFKDEFELAGIDDMTVHLRADAFIFADSPTVQKVAQRLGYTVLVYHDLFQGAEFAAPELLGIEVVELDGIDTEYDLESEPIAAHETFRILSDDAVEPLEAVSTRTILEETTEEILRAGSEV